MPVIEVKGHGEIEFPDSMSMDAIREVLRRKFGVQQKQSGPPGQMGKYGGLPGDQANLTQTATERFAQDVGSLGEDVRDYGKVSLDAISGRDMKPTTGGGRLAKAGVDAFLGAAKGVVGTGADIASLFGVNVSPDLQAAVEPENTAQSVGQFGERIAEFAVPGGAIAKGAKALPVGRGLALGAEAIGQGALAGGIDLLHGEDMATAKRDAAIAAVFPVAGKAVEKMLKTASVRGVDRFFKQTTKERRRGFGASVGETLQSEGVAGMRAQTLRDNVQSRIDGLKTEIANEVAEKSAKTTPLLDVSSMIDGELDKSVRLAKMANNDAAGKLESAKEAIALKIDELSGGSGVLDLKGLDALRTHISSSMLKDAGHGMYRDELLKLYNYTRKLLTVNAPSVGEKLSRESRLINAVGRIDQKITELSTKQGGISDLAVGGLAGVVGGTLGNVAGALAAGNAIRRAFQYTPGRMAIAGAERGMGSLAGFAGPAFAATAVAQDGRPSAPTGQAPVAPTSAPRRPVGGPVGSLSEQIDAAASRANVDPLLLAALVSAESGGNPNARSNKGAVGLTQMTPIALKEIGMTPEDIKTPEGQLLAGGKYLRLMLDQYNGNVSLALAAYNAGPGAVNRHKGIPPFKETQAYVPRVLRFYGALGGDVATTMAN